MSTTTSIAVFCIMFSFLSTSILTAYAVVADDVEPSDVFLSALAAVEGEQEGPFNHLLENLSTGEKKELLWIAAARSRQDIIEIIISEAPLIDSVTAEGWTPLMIALANGNENLALWLIEQGANVDLESKDGLKAINFAGDNISPKVGWALVQASQEVTSATFLSMAAAGGDVAAIRHALASGVSPDALDENGSTALLMAVQNRQLDAVELIVNSGGNVDTTSADGLSPLGAAVLGGDIDATRLLLGAGANPNISLEGMPLLSISIASGNRELVDELIGAGADVAVQDSLGVTPGALAHNLGLVDLAEELGYIPPKPITIDSLIEAINKQDLEHMRHVFDSGISPDATLPNGWKPIHLAAADEKVNALAAMKPYRDRLDSLSYTPDGDTAMTLAIQLLDDGTKLASTIKHLASIDTDLIGKPDVSGKTPLLHAVVANKLIATKTIVEQLIHRPNAGISNSSRMNAVDIPDKTGATPILASVLSGNARAVEQVLRLNPKLTAAPNGMSLQNISRTQGDFEILALLPDDRQFPFSLQLNLKDGQKRIIQEKLSEWGYYNGPIDGVIGAGSRAAMKAFLLDRMREIEEMNNVIPNAFQRSWQTRNIAQTKEDAALKDLEISLDGSSCIWTLIRWNVTKATSAHSSQVFGCFEGKPRWNSNGYGLVVYGPLKEEKNLHDAKIVLFGSTGWEKRRNL